MITIPQHTTPETFQDTGKTITHRGQTFQILTTDHPDADSPYILRSKRGKFYILTRSRPTPHQMFGVCWEGLKCLPGWFTDKSGELVSLG